LHPKKRFGQNFLHDGNQMRRILDAAGVPETTAGGDVVLEVGPGTGALTVRLLHAGARVVAVEIDRDLAGILRDELGGHARFTLIEADVLAGKHTLNPDVLAALGGERCKLVANLPYNVASPLMINLLKQCPAMTGGVVMVQKEVAERIEASHGGKDYGPLTVLMQAACLVERVSTLPPGCFWPAPQVGSAVVKFTRRDEPLTDDLDALGAFCQTLFQKRRKQLGSILGRDRDWPDGVTPEQRPESLSVEQIVALSRAG
jgi:16S rRNA (adenine1518-N6/adenine1519-N6)-dimethyltransferase